jgi:hypothetical protein
MNHPASLTPTHASSPTSGRAGLAATLIAAVVLASFAAMVVAHWPAPAQAEAVDEIPPPPVMPPAARSTVPDAATVFAGHDRTPEVDAPTF